MEFLRFLSLIGDRPGGVGTLEPVIIVRVLAYNSWMIVDDISNVITLENNKRKIVS